MSDITLSAGVRQNLLSLQSTASLLSTTQERLATGKKVNSALDNPSNFFTSQSLNNRASDLNALLDSIGQATQTITAATQGITSLTNLVQSAKSIATQAQQATKGTVNFTQITGSVVVAADSTQITSTNTVASQTGSIAASTQSNVNITAAGITNLKANDTLIYQLGSGTAQTVTFTAAAGNGTTTFHTAADLQTDLNAAFAGSATATSAGGAVTLTSNDLSNNFTISGTGVADAQTNSATDLTHANLSLGDALTVTDSANHSTSFYYVANFATPNDQTFHTIGDLVNAVNNNALAIHANITASNSTGALTLASAGAITVAGNIGTDLAGINGTTNGNFNSTLNGLSGTLTVDVAGNATHTVTFGNAFGQVSTKAALTAALNGFTDITAGYNGSNQIQLTPQSSANVTIGGAASILTGLGLTAQTLTPSSTVVAPNATRANLQDQYNALLSQIDQLAGDASYNGINLLNGDNLKVVFNESDTSSLTIQGVKFNSAGLGLTAVSGTGFQDNNKVNTTLGTVQTALTTLRAQAAAFGSNESTVEARQDFTKDLISTLQTGSDKLVLADTNEEGANLLALQTRQQLSITSLSLASQADQAILKIL